MNIFLRIIYQASRLILQLFKPMTNGVRVLLIREDQVLMVKHVYEEEWYLPGGLVEKGETLEDAIRREVWEEVGAEMKDLQLYGVFTNFKDGSTDHITVFISREFQLNGKTDHEIEQVSLFGLQALPEKTSPGSRNRIMDYISGNNRGFGNW